MWRAVSFCIKRALGWQLPVERELILSIAVINTMTKSGLGRRRFIWCTHPDHSPLLRGVKRILPTGFFSIAYYRTYSHLPKPKCTEQFHINYQSINLPRDYSNEDTFSIEVSLSKMTLACVRLTKQTKKQQQQNKNRNKTKQKTKKVFKDKEIIVNRHSYIWVKVILKS